MMNPTDPITPSHNIILRTCCKLIVPLGLLFSAYLYFKGHQTPGGGFVGGLAAAVSLIAYRMAEGPDRLRKLLPFSERIFIVIGLSLALGTGLGALVQGLPFFTSNNGYIPLPGGTKFHWATVMFFDAGVYLVVLGTVVGMINALSEESE